MGKNPSRGVIIMERLIEKALSLEEKGHKFYIDMAEKASNALARALFENLALDEQRHAEWIHKIQERLQEEYPTDSAGAGVSIKDRIREVFDSLDTAEEKPGQETVRGLEIAMQLEKEALELYGELLELDPSPAEKAFLEKIMQQEWQHLEALRNVHFYLTRTGEWFDQEESQRWNWMNI